MMGMIGLFVLAVAGFVVVASFVGLVVVITIFVRQKIREGKENRQ
jgi:hypothetical protein